MADSLDIIKGLGPLILALEENEDVQLVLNDEYHEMVAQLEQNYEAAKADAEAKKKLEAFAKGITEFSKGILSAVDGFQRNDPLTGSAGVIDAVSSIISTVSAMSAAGGPAGAVASSLLSVVSMMLRFFAAKEPSKPISEQLDKVIRNYDSEKIIEELKAQRNHIEEIVENTEPAMYQSMTYKDVKDYYLPKFYATHNAIEKVTEWLQNPKNQSLELWGLVLANQCQTFIAYMQLGIVAMAKIKPESEGKNIETFKNEVVHIVRKPQLKFLKKIAAAARNRGTVWVCFDGYLHYRDTVVSKQKDKWKYAGEAPYSGNRMLSLAVTTRPMSAFQAQESPYPLLAQFSVENKYERYDISNYSAKIDKVGADDAYEALTKHPFQTKGFKSNKIRGRFGRPPFKKHGTVLKNAKAAEKLPPVYDVWAMPGFAAHRVFVYMANQDQITIWEHGSGKHSKTEERDLHKLWEIGYPAGYKVGIVRSVIPKSLPDEDQQVLAPEPIHDTPQVILEGDSANPLSDSKDYVVSVVYGGCEVQGGKSQVKGDASFGNEDHMEIRGHFLTHFKKDYKNKSRKIIEGSFLSRWENFVGISTDSRYLWVFRAGAIACATHTSVKQCLEDGKAKPDWMEYKIPEEGVGEKSFDPETRGDSFSKRGLIDLCACDDGTLTAIFCDWGLVRPVYTMTPKIDRHANKGNRLSIEGKRRDDFGHELPTSGWNTDRSKTANRVVKIPIFCWPLIESLTASLEKID